MKVHFCIKKIAVSPFQTGGVIRFSEQFSMPLLASVILWACGNFAKRHFCVACRKATISSCKTSRKKPLTTAKEYTFDLKLWNHNSSPCNFILKSYEYFIARIVRYGIHEGSYNLFNCVSSLMISIYRMISHFTKSHFSHSSEIKFLNSDRILHYIFTNFLQLKLMYKGEEK